MLIRKTSLAVGALALALTGCSQGSADLKSADQQTGAGSDAAAEAASPFYVDPSSNPAVWVKKNPRDARAAAIKKSIATKPGAKWFGNWSGDIGKSVSAYVTAAQKAKKTPILVAYNITDRDCSGHSGGGAGSAAKYRTWISKFASAIGNRPAVVIIEPDAVAQLDCLPAASRKTRTALLSYATKQFQTKAKKSRAYLDGGNSNWIAPATMATRLNAAGVKNVRGFSINVSNFFTTAQSAAYGKKVNAALKSKYRYTKKFVIDTSRNGKGGVAGQWCNPAGRKLGATSRTGGTSGAEYLLWIKVPGDSDGPCGVGAGIPAGTFSPVLATRLIKGS
ncbi:glycoside hydrolase family 6 protein [Spirillospora sp. NPDC048911]|uniref:glycoside hydrolase family 6 protein n=1 Tax=Spirillospora sp. NPDC048911 TaxID=3364527 RepID=UPI00371C3DE5